MSNTFIKAVGVSKTFKVGDAEIPVLHDVNLEIEKGDFAIIFGPSGSGKSTLLHTLLGLEPPSTGEILMEDKSLYALNDDERALYRRNKVGMIYQQALWIGALDVIGNITFALNLLDLKPEEIETKGAAALEAVGMQDWAHYHPAELSSGQQQKISLARAMVVDPVLLVADEPTGNLDTVSGLNLVQTFLDVNAKGITILMITHELDYLKYATKLVHILDGKVVEVRTPKKKLTKVEQGTGHDATLDLRSPDYLKRLGL